MASGERKGTGGDGTSRSTPRRKKAARRKVAARKPARPGAGGRSGKSSRGSQRPRHSSGARFIRSLGWALGAMAFVLGVWASRWVLELDDVVVARFDGRQFAVPSKVLAAPEILYPGLSITQLDLVERLRRTGYREQKVKVGRPLRPGLYRSGPDRLRVHLRAFDHPTRPEPARDIVVRFEGDQIYEIRELPRSREVGAVLIEPELVGAYFGVEREQRDLVRLGVVPPALIAAVIAVEDRRFEEHHGVDLRRIAGAVVANLRAGGVRQGGSTLTQQLVKNFYLTPERTLRRKAREAVMALLVEARYTKSEILESYLNEIYLGQRGSTAVHGIGEAANFYFGKAVGDLSTAECALLAGIIQSPNRLSPRNHVERARKRRDLVLELMRRQGRIDLATFNAARAEDITVATHGSVSGDARYFLDALRVQLPKVYNSELLQTEGLKIYSTLDSRLQGIANRALADGLAKIERSNPALVSTDPAKRLQGCLVVMRPQTGEVLAMVGGRNYGESQFNRCTQARRQPGSVFKIFVYLAALEGDGQGSRFTTASLLEDTPIEIETRDGLWLPANYDHKFRGLVTLRSALERSLNVPSVRLGLEVGPARVAEMARRLGVASPLPHVPSLVLGTASVSPMDLLLAYATLANGGVRPSPHTFEDVVSPGRTLERRTLEFSRVLDPGVAYLGVSLLEGVVNRGTARRVRAMGMRGPIAGKTGTTDDERDLWFVGFTPNLVAAVWLGFDEPRSIGVSSSAGPLPIWVDFMREAVGEEVPGFFFPPSDIETIPVEPASGALALAGCPEIRDEYFLVGTGPTMLCDHRSTRVANELRSLRATRGRGDHGRTEPGGKEKSSREGFIGWLRNRF